MQRDLVLHRLLSRHHLSGWDLDVGVRQYRADLRHLHHRGLFRRRLYQQLFLSQLRVGLLFREHLSRVFDEHLRYVRSSLCVVQPDYLEQLHQRAVRMWYQSAVRRRLAVSEQRNLRRRLRPT